MASHPTVTTTSAAAAEEERSSYRLDLQDGGDANLFKESQLYLADFVVIIVYFLSVLTVGIWSSYRSRKKSKDDGNLVGGYFLASRDMPFFLVGASLFASNIGSEHFIGLAGSGAAAGIAVASYEVNAIFILHLLGWFFVPVYLVSGIYTMPEYMRTRFGGQRIRVLLSVLALLAYVFTKISADLYAGALFIKLSFGLSGLSGLYVSILILLGLAAFFTIFGGLSAVIWTDFIQAILMVIGALILMFITFGRVGSIPEIFDKYAIAVADDEYQNYDHNNKSCGLPRHDFAHFFRDADTGDIPWTGVFTGMIINSIWYWCADQVIVQRTLASKNITHAKGGVVFAAYCKLLPFFMLVIPGMAARVLWPNYIACSNPQKCEEICGSQAGCSNISYVLLVLKLLPSGMRGLMLAVMLAALMSSLTSIFNSASTIFTMDIWKLVRRNASDLELIVIGRCTVVLLVGVSILWIPVILSFKNPQLFLYIQAISSYLAPPMTAVFIMALVWHRMTEPGAFWGLLFGFFVGMIRFILEFAFRVPQCGPDDEDPRPQWVVDSVGHINFLHFSPLSFVITAVVAFAVSLVTKPIKDEQLHRLTFWSRFSLEKRKPIDEEETKPIVRKKKDEPGYLGLLCKLCCVKREEIPEEDVVANEEDEGTIRATVEIIKEDKKFKNFVQGAALVVLCTACFIWGYFA